MSLVRKIAMEIVIVLRDACDVSSVEKGCKWKITHYSQGCVDAFELLSKKANGEWAVQVQIW